MILTYGSYVLCMRVRHVEGAMLKEWLKTGRQLKIAILTAVAIVLLPLTVVVVFIYVTYKSIESMIDADERMK